MKSAKTIIECLAKATSTEEIANLEGLLNQARSRSPDSFISDVLGVIISSKRLWKMTKLIGSQILEFSEGFMKRKWLLFSLNFIFSSTLFYCKTDD